MADHHWTKDEEDQWAVRCEVKQMNFSPQHPAFVNTGKCPYCDADAHFEMERRKKERQEKERLSAIEQKKQENLKAKNTLTGYM